MKSINSPAKINLFLRILSRRSDGYHEIASLFQAISLYDRLHYCFSDSDQLTCTDPYLSCDASNLVVRALNIFREKSGINFSLKIHLEKNIPMEAGLGGGSANAATMLFLCNVLHGCPMTEGQLAEIGSEIGSDVPFFFSTGSAFCTGRGEHLESTPQVIIKKNIWLVKPHVGLSTKLIFKNLQMNQCAKLDPKQLLHNWLLGSTISVNDLEESAFRLMPELETLKRTLQDQGFESVFMTGSGTALVCIGDRKPVVDQNVTCYCVSFVNRKPGEWY